MHTTLNRPNRYASTCVRCGARIAATAGLLARNADGSWAADHIGDCPEKPMAIAAPTVRAEHEGTYIADDGTTYRVRATSTGRLYAERRDEHDGMWIYAPGVIHTLREDQRQP